MDASDFHPPMALLSAALLHHNELNATEAFEGIAQEGASFITISDFEDAFVTLDLGCDVALVRQTFHDVDTNRDGKIDLEEWTAAITNPDGLSDVLKSRGLLTDSSAAANSSVSLDTEGETQDALLQVAAVLQYNAMTPRAGFDQFDADEDGKLSVKDLVTTALELGIEASEEALGRLHAMMDDAQDGMVTQEAFERVVKTVDGTNELTSRGIQLPAMPEVDESLLTPEASFKAKTLSQEDPSSPSPEVATSTAMPSETNGGGAGTPEEIEGQEASKWEKMATRMASSSSSPEENGKLVPSADAKEAIDLFAATLAFSNLTNEEGFDEIDFDNDGKISLKDLLEGSAKMELEVDDKAVREMHALMDDAGDGLASFESWMKVVSLADVKSVLDSRGVEATKVGFDEKVFEKAVAAARGGELSGRGTGRSTGRGTGRSSLLDARTPRDISNMIAALLVYNELTVAEGFVEFDADGDGEISIEDFLTSAKELSIEANEHSLRLWHKKFAPWADGKISEIQWIEELEGANATAVLEEVGVDPNKLSSTPRSGDHKGGGVGLSAQDGGVGGALGSWIQDGMGRRPDVSLDAVKKSNEGNGGDRSKEEREAAKGPTAESSPRRLAAAGHDIASSSAAPPAKTAAAAAATEAKAGAGASSSSLAEPSVVSGAMSRSGPADPAEVDEARDLIAATLKFNKFTLEMGFEELDYDLDGRISVSDLTRGCQEMALLGSIRPEAIDGLVHRMGKDGLVEIDDWLEGFGSAESDKVLHSRGLASALERQSATAAENLLSFKEVSDTIAAVLQYNDMTVDDGFVEFDVDEDGFISLDDLSKCAKQLEIEVEDGVLAAWHSHNCVGMETVLHESDWRRALARADGDTVLETRGVKAAEGVIMKESLDVIAAVIKYNDMSFDEGFGAFDVDGDGFISKHDLSSAAEILQLDLTTEELMAVHKALDVYDDGLVVKAEWMRVLNTSEGDEVLKTLGVQVEHHHSDIGAQGEGGAEAKRLFTDQDRNGSASTDVAAASSDTGNAGNANVSDGSFLEGHFANSSPSSASKQRRGSGGSVEGLQRRDTPLEGEMLLHLENAEVSRPRQRRPSTADEVFEEIKNEQQHGDLPSSSHVKTPQTHDDGQAKSRIAELELLLAETEKRSQSDKAALEEKLDDAGLKINELEKVVAVHKEKTGGLEKKLREAQNESNELRERLALVRSPSSSSPTHPWSAAENSGNVKNHTLEKPPSKLDKEFAGSNQRGAAGLTAKDGEALKSDVHLLKEEIHSLQSQLAESMKTNRDLVHQAALERKPSNSGLAGSASVKRAASGRSVGSGGGERSGKMVPVEELEQTAELLDDAREHIQTLQFQLKFMAEQAMLATGEDDKERAGLWEELEESKETCQTLEFQLKNMAEQAMLATGEDDKERAGLWEELEESKEKCQTLEFQLKNMAEQAMLATGEDDKEKARLLQDLELTMKERKELVEQVSQLTAALAEALEKLPPAGDALSAASPHKATTVEASARNVGGQESTAAELKDRVVELEYELDGLRKQLSGFRRRASMRAEGGGKTPRRTASGGQAGDGTNDADKDAKLAEAIKDRNDLARQVSQLTAALAEALEKLPSAPPSSAAAAPGNKDVPSAAPWLAVAKQQQALDLMQASLAFNKLSIDDGFHAFDHDGDGLISVDDFKTSLAELAVPLSPADVTALHVQLDTDKDGFLSFPDFTTAMSAADASNVLRSLGIIAEANSIGLVFASPSKSTHPADYAGLEVIQSAKKAAKEERHELAKQLAGKLALDANPSTESIMASSPPNDGGQRAMEEAMEELRRSLEADKAAARQEERSRGEEEVERVRNECDKLARQGLAEAHEQYKAELADAKRDMARAEEAHQKAEAKAVEAQEALAKAEEAHRREMESLKKSLSQMREAGVASSPSSRRESLAGRDSDSEIVRLERELKDCVEREERARKEVAEAEVAARRERGDKEVAEGAVRREREGREYAEADAKRAKEAKVQLDEEVLRLEGELRRARTDADEKVVRLEGELRRARESTSGVTTSRSDEAGASAAAAMLEDERRSAEGARRRLEEKVSELESKVKRAEDDKLRLEEAERGLRVALERANNSNIGGAVVAPPTSGDDAAILAARLKNAERDAEYAREDAKIMRAALSESASASAAAAAGALEVEKGRREAAEDEVMRLRALEEELRAVNGKVQQEVMRLTTELAAERGRREASVGGDLDGEVVRLKAREEELRADNNRRQQEVVRLKALEEELRADNSKTQREVTRLTTELARGGERIRGLEADVARLSAASVTKLGEEAGVGGVVRPEGSGEVEEMESRAVEQATSGKLQALMGHMALLKEEVEAANAAKMRAEGEADALRAKVGASEAGRKSAEEKAARCDEEIASLERQVASLRDEIARLKKAASEKIIKENENHGSTGGGESLTASLADRLAQSEDRALRATTDLSIMTRERDGLIDATNRLTRELGEARTTIAKLRDEGASTVPTTAVEEAEQRTRAAEARADALQRQVDSLRQRLESSRLPALNGGRGMEGRKEYERPGIAGEGSQQDKARPSSAGGVPREPAGGVGPKRPESPSSSSKSADEKLKGLIKENSQCHAQIRMLSAEVVGLSEALEMVTRRASEQRDAAEQHERAQQHHQQDKSSKGSASGGKKKKSSSSSSFKRRSAAAEYPDVMSTRIYTAATGVSNGGRRAADETSPSRPGQVARLQGDLFPGFYEGGGASSGAGARHHAWG